MTTSHQQFVWFGALVLLITVGLTVAMVPASAGVDATSTQESTLEEAMEDADVPDAVEPNESFAVDASAIGDRDDVDEVCWLFDAGDTCHDAETTHVFEEAGSHTATVVVTDENGDRSSVTNLIVATTAPTAELSVPEDIEADSEVTLDASGSSDDHEIVEYQWDLTGDGTVDEATTSSELTYDFEDGGTHDVTVTVVDTAGQTDTATETVEIADTSSVADGGSMTIIAALIIGGALAIAGALAFTITRGQDR